MQAARHKCQRLARLPGHLAPSNLAGAYHVQEQRLPLLGQKLAAFKLGGTNAATREAFQCSEPYYGALAASELVGEGKLVWPEAIAPVVEPEIAIALNVDLPPRESGYSAAFIRDHIAWIAPALEMPDTVLENPMEAGLAWLLSDGCAAGKLVIGEHLTSDELPDLEASDAELLLDGVIVGTGGASCIIGGVLETLAVWTRILSQTGQVWPKNVPVATGGCTLACSLQGVTSVEVRFGDVARVHIAQLELGLRSSAS